MAPSIPLPHDASLADVSAKHFGVGVTGGASGHPPRGQGRIERPQSDHSGGELLTVVKYCGPNWFLILIISRLYESCMGRKHFLQ